MHVLMHTSVQTMCTIVLALRQYLNVNAFDIHLQCFKTGLLLIRFCQQIHCFIFLNPHRRLLSGFTLECWQSIAGPTWKHHQRYLKQLAVEMQPTQTKTRIHGTYVPCMPMSQWVCANYTSVHMIFGPLSCRTSPSMLRLMAVAKNLL